MVHAVNSVPMADRVRAVSSVYGKIEQILLVIDGDYQDFEVDRIPLFFRELLQRFSDRVSFLVMGHFGHGLEESLRHALRQNGFLPDLALVHTPLSGGEESQLRHVHGAFVQDPFIATQSDLGEVLLLESYRPSLSHNAFLARQLADATGYGLLSTRLHIEGGNVLIGDDYALVGRNLLDRNRMQLFPDMDREEAEALITSEFKRRLGMRYICWIGDRERGSHPLGNGWGGPEGLQPFYHIDLFLALGGKTATGDELVLLAQIDPGSIDPAPHPAQSEVIMKMNAWLQRIGNQLRDPSETSSGPRFHVVELPMSGSFTGEHATAFTPYSYHNAQVECYHGIKRIYLPSFPRRASLEERIRAQLLTLGFHRVDFLRYDFEEFARRRGGLHCLTKVIRRGG